MTSSLWVLWIWTYYSEYSVIFPGTGCIWRKSAYSTGGPRRGNYIAFCPSNMPVILFVSSIYLYTFRYLDVNEIQTIHADRLSHLKSLTRLWVFFLALITIRFLVLRQTVVQKIQSLNSKDFIFWSTHHYIPEHRGLHNSICGNLKCYKYLFFEQICWKSYIDIRLKSCDTILPKFPTFFLIHGYSVRCYHYL
jgi:hypothetical protein